MILQAIDLFGTLPGWLTLGMVMIVAYFLRGAAGGQAIDIIRDQRDVLAERVSELEDKIKGYEKRISELEAMKDVTVALRPLFEWLTSHEKLDEGRHSAMEQALLTLTQSMQTHEERADARASTLATITAENADRLARVTADTSSKTLNVLDKIADRISS